MGLGWTYSQYDSTKRTKTIVTATTLVKTKSTTANSNNRKHNKENDWAGLRHSTPFMPSRLPKQRCAASRTRAQTARTSLGQSILQDYWFRALVWVSFPAACVGTLIHKVSMMKSMLLIVSIRSNEHVHSFQPRHNGAAGIAACVNVTAPSPRTNLSAQQASLKPPGRKGDSKPYNPNAL